MSEIFQATDLINFSKEALIQAGIPTFAALKIAEIMVAADLQAVESHGISMLPVLIDNLKFKAVQSRCKVSLLWEKQAVAMMDGDHAPGQWVSYNAMEKAIEIASRFHCAFVIAKNSSHWGRAAFYARMAAERNMIGLCMSNTYPNFPIWGAREKSIGNNPMALACPCAGGSPMVLDFAMSQVSWGKIGTYIRQGRSIPSHWGLGPAGKPTTDPKEVLESGRLLPIGDAKGSGLAIMVEVLTALLGGGAFLADLFNESGKTGMKSGWTQSFLAIDISAFMPVEQFLGRVDEFQEQLKKASPNEWTKEIRLPGERV